MKRRKFIQQSALGAMSFLASPAFFSCVDGAKKTNIIFMMADDLGYGHLGCYGQQKIKTPNIDQLAAEGVQFSQCYAGAPVCAPSRSVLMTGLHSGHTAIRGNFGSGGTPLYDEDVTVAEVLKSAGYTTGLFGKWGLGDVNTTGVPNKQGFDQFFGYLNQVHGHYYYPYYLWENEKKYLLPGNEGGKREQYTHDVIVEKAMRFIDQNKDSPFFLYLPFVIPHVELLVPEDSFKEYEGKFPEPNPWIDEIGHYADQPAPRTTLAAMISRMDKNVGRIMAQLKDLGLDDNTIVFFCSDNGAQNKKGADLHFFEGNGVLRGKKADLYEGGIRVPMIVRWPGKINPGTKSDYTWAFHDVMPTLTELAGTKPPDSIDGLSVLPALLGESQSSASHEFFYWEFEKAGILHQAVRYGAWKGHRKGEGATLALYNLDTDISETTDVAEQHPEIVKEIETYLKTARTQPRDYEHGAPTWSYRKEDTGYIR
jgi:arylsulfatase A